MAAEANIDRDDKWFIGEMKRLEFHVREQNEDGTVGGGEVFRSGLCYRRGRGRIFYFRPGHEENPSYHNPDVQRVIRNAVSWATPTPGAVPVYGHSEPIG